MFEKWLKRSCLLLVSVAVLGVMAAGGAQPDVPTHKTCKAPDEVVPNVFVYDGVVKEDRNKEGPGRLSMFRDDTGKWYWVQKCVEGDKGTAAQKKQNCQCFEMTKEGFEQYLRDRDASSTKAKKEKGKSRLEKMLGGGSGNGGGNGGRCFAAGTYVLMADGSFKDIQDIQVGESVMSVDSETGVELAGRVYETREGSESYVYVLNGGLRVNAAHKFYTDKGLKTAPEISVGDVILGRDGGRTSIASVTVESVVLAASEAVRPEISVHNLMVEGTHTFIVSPDKVDLYLVHDDCSCGN